VVTQVDPPRTWGGRGIYAPIRATVHVAVEPVTEASARVTDAVDVDGHGIGRGLVPLVGRRQARTEMPVNIAALKERVEALAQPPARVVTRPCPGSRGCGGQPSGAQVLVLVPSEPDGDVAEPRNRS
jgi:hypothetical protein